MAVAWAGKPEGDRVMARVLRLKPGCTAFIRVLDEPEGVWLHWVDGKTLPHHDDTCALCGKGPIVWKAYAPGQVWNDLGGGKGVWSLCVIELTEGLKIPETMMRQTYQLTRLPSTSQARFSLKAVKDMTGEAWGETFDVRPVLERLWGMYSKANLRPMESRPLGSSDTGCDDTSKLSRRRFG